KSAPNQANASGRAKRRSPPRPRSTFSTPESAVRLPAAIKTNRLNSASAKHTPAAAARYGPFDLFSTTAGFFFAMFSLQSRRPRPAGPANGHCGASYIIQGGCKHCNQIGGRRKSVRFSSYCQHIFHRLSTAYQQENFRGVLN